MSEILLETIGLSKRFCRRPEYALRYALADMWREIRGLPQQEELRPGEFWALRNVDLRMEKGEVLGVVGHNGAGKSTLINLVAGLIRPTQGCVRLYTNRVALMDNQGGLNMVETGRENIATQLALHGCPDERIQEEARAVIAFAELGEFIDAAVGTYSLGMRLRLAFSIYTRLKPDLFIVDEAISGGDIRFRHRFQNYIRSYIDDGGSILFCSHELPLVQMLCKRSVLLDHGCMRMCGDTLDVIQTYQTMLIPTSDEAQPLPDEAEEQAFAGEADVMSQALMLVTDHTHEDRPDHKNGEHGEGETNAFPQPPSRVGEEGMPIIESVSIRPLDGDALQPGGAAELEIVCQVSRPFREIGWSTEIGRGDLFPIATLIGGLGKHKYCLTPGRNCFHGRIDHLPLAPGVYEMRIAISDLTTGANLALHGYENRPVSFQIVHRPDRLLNLMVYRNNVVYINVDWS
jgi:lipopolysaccharide transport system ATP-binding protein